ncbi:hypothetical protein AZF37_00880 [endosymbiont 'TC1' of Trimyema compressum]|uniref:hypothetical protein n=1 Tax=endosymbiont 'TC1' of Trimyema compressum TaxID=243899 RepID=UPI0007F13D73|nr:hypothetical protein [endosymbiont 'TC1' of Trimyema compressum]AMP19924.1 hypothetical protein AZF37_00880 [endosymbiont 'TC1' of Trimyema compressum]
MKSQSLAMFKKAIMCLLIIAMLFTSLSFTQPCSLKAEEPVTNQTEKPDTIQEQVVQVKEEASIVGLQPLENIPANQCQKQEKTY